MSNAVVLEIIGIKIANGVFDYVMDFIRLERIFFISHLCDVGILCTVVVEDLINETLGETYIFNVHTQNRCSVKQQWH